MLHALLPYLWLYLTIGVLAGTASGLLGLGGGIVVVPGLDYLFVLQGMPAPHVMHMAAATSLAVMCLTTQVSAWTYHRRRLILWSAYRRLLPGIVLGVIAGSIAADYVPNNVLRILFAAVVIIIAMRMFLLIEPHPDNRMPPWYSVGLVGFFIGGKSGLLGIGGGALTVPFLARCHVPMRKTTGTTALCSFTIAVTGTACQLAQIKVHPIAVPGTIGDIYLPAVGLIASTSMLSAYLAAHWSKHVPVRLLKQIFAVCLLFMGIHMLWR